MSLRRQPIQQVRAKEIKLESLKCRPVFESRSITPRKVYVYVIYVYAKITTEQSSSVKNGLQ